MGSPLKIVEIPVRVRRLEPLILDENMRCFQPQGAIEDDGGGFQLSRYPEIGRLVIPESLDIPHDEWFSPFATYHGRGFCIDRHTRWEKVKIYEIENRSPHLTVKDGELYSADMRRLIYCFEEMDTFTVPPQVATIEPFAFCGQTRLKQITLHEGITDMGPAAFMGCSRLQEVIIPPRGKANTRRLLQRLRIALPRCTPRRTPAYRQLRFPHMPGADGNTFASHGDGTLQLRRMLIAPRDRDSGRDGARGGVHVLPFAAKGYSPRRGAKHFTTTGAYGESSSKTHLAR